MVTARDRKILRDLAKRQADLAREDRNKSLRTLWKEHNAYRGSRPMVTVETDTLAQDLLPQKMLCETEIARQIEYNLLLKQINYVVFKDDSVLPPYYPVRHYTYIRPFGLDVKVTRTEGVGHHFEPQIEDLGKDFSLLNKSTFHCRDDLQEEHIRFAEDAFGDILPVKYEGISLCCSLTQDLVHLMGMENMFYSMYDYPELFQEMMGMLSDDYIAYFQYLSERNLILPTNEGERVGQGTYAFNDLLPKDKQKYTPKDVWGYMDSQETVGVSEEMFEKLIYPYYKKVASEFGLLSYGCCEPVHPIWDSCIRHFSNLRRVSISPWCDERFMGEKLSRSGIIYHRKPDPTILGVGAALDEDRLRKHIKSTVDSAKGCKIEFSQRDVYTVNKDERKVARYVEIVREESEEAYGK